MDDPYSHEAYEVWWRTHGGAREGLAQHAETHLNRAGSRSLIRRCRTLFDLYDFFAVRYGPLLATEAFRRALWTLAFPPAVARTRRLP